MSDGNTETTTAQKKPVPPKIAPKPGHVKVLRALHTYTAQQEDELSFEEGDILYLVDNKSDKNWWKARCGPKCGLIPSNYVELKTEAVENPVHDAARRGNLEFLKECLSHGVSAIDLDSSGCSPLHWATRCGHVDCTQELLKAASKQLRNIKQFVNVQNKLGETALHGAASKSHLEVVKILLENFANVSLLNKMGQLPIDLAYSADVKSALKLAKTVQDANPDNPDEEEYLTESDPED